MRVLAITIAVLFLSCPVVFAEDIHMQAILYPPLVYKSGDGLCGVAPDVVRAIQAEVDDSNPLVVVPWLRAYELAQSSPRQALFAIVRIPEREALFKWVGPVFSEGDYFFQKRGAGLNIRTLDDARKVARIAVRRDGYTHQALKARGFGNLDVGPSYDTSYQKLVQGRVDLVLMGERTYYFMVREAGLDPEDFERTDCKLGESSAWLAFSRDIPDETIARWQAVLDRLKADGTYDDILRRNFRR
ncbi:transporter substrate-binding domain-containing protein [Pseudodesulfovibrio sp.]|uniref:substrate-binding periplasmic protein n=1 Tax=Pseudodesulfovibrio sp. TaxID=2035812 RepID=UPI00262104A6|nr:transporter substrate-binding domain-containing protein [Pseudodesulfovibrio sp.]MDD3312578.1 transporter substrate-binding domain-containing protein [Pseudodesulfovibrio sp.]